MRFLASVIALIFGASVASAASYQMFDHPSGAKASSYDYGLRLEYVAGNSAGSYWSFEDLSNNSMVTLDVDVAGGTGSVSGSMRYNLDDSIWTLDLAMTGVTSLASIGAGADSFGATTYSGTLSNGTTTYALGGKAKDVKGTGYQWTYFSSDPGDAGGSTDFRGPNISAGWIGSVNGNTTMNTGTNDFIGTMVAAPTPVPVPATGLLLLSSFAAFGFMRRRRAKA